MKILHSLLFPGSPWDDDGEGFWLVYEKGKYYPVGFAIVRRDKIDERYAVLLRAGVLPEAQGHNLQQALIEVREQWAQRRKHKGIHATVANWNTASLVNLLKSGYQIIDPQVKRGRKLVAVPRDGYQLLAKDF